MKRYIKYTLGCGCLGIVIAVIFLFVASLIIIGNGSEGTPIRVDYHTKSDLYRVSNVKFPDVCLVDSHYYDSFNLMEFTEKFVLKNPKDKSYLMGEIEKVIKVDSIYWSKSSDSVYIYYILPEMPINRPAGTGWRMTDDGSRDWDGDFIRMEIPQYSDTIILKYGWER